MDFYEYLATQLGLAVVVFASTNIDDIFVLVGFLADPRFRLRNVALGQYIGVGALVALSIAASLLSLAFAPDYVGLLGLLPVGIGLVRLGALLRPSARPDDERHEARASPIGQIASVALVTFANGGDNIGVYTPLFATQSAAASLMTVIAFALLTGVWIGMAHRLVGHPKLGAPIRRYGHIVVPFILIGLGFYVLYEDRSLQLLRSVLAQNS